MNHWLWIAAGLGLVIFEVMTPGFYFLWIGLAALATGVLAFLFPNTGFVVLGTIFGILSLAFCYFGKVSLYKKVKGDESNTLNRRGHQYIGRSVIVAEDIVNGVGKVKVDDTVWNAKSDADKKKGDTVKIVKLDGISFVVE